MTEQESIIHELNKIKEDLAGIKEQLQRLLNEFDQNIWREMDRTAEELRKLEDDLERVYDLLSREQVDLRIHRLGETETDVYLHMKVIRGIGVRVHNNTTISEIVDLLKKKLVENYSANVKEINDVLLSAVRLLKYKYEAIENIRSQIARLSEKIERVEDEVAEIHNQIED